LLAGQSDQYEVKVATDDDTLDVNTASTPGGG